MTLERQILVWAAALAAIGYLLYLLGGAVAPFAAGIALGYLLDPVVRRMQSFGLSRLVASLIILVVFIVVAALAAAGRRAGAGDPVRQLRPETAGLRDAAAGAGGRRRQRAARSLRRRMARLRLDDLGRPDPEVGRRLRRARARNGCSTRCGRSFPAARRFSASCRSSSSRRSSPSTSWSTGTRWWRRSTAGCRSTIATCCGRSRPRSIMRSPASSAASRWSVCSSACGTGSD